MVVGVGRGEDRLLHPAEEALAQGFVGLEGGQQVLAPVVGGRVRVECLAVVHQCAFQVFAVQTEAVDQPMDGHQHRPGDVVGVDLVAAHHQQRRAAFGLQQVFLQQPVDLQQAIGRWVMRLAAGAVEQLVETWLEHQAGALATGVEQMRRPFGDSRRLPAVGGEAQVVVDQAGAGQRRVERDIQQVQPGMGADADGRVGSFREADPTLRLAFAGEDQFDGRRA